MPVAHDSVGDIIKDCAQQGLLDELRSALKVRTEESLPASEVIKDLIFELSGAQNRDLAVDVLIHATGVAEFGSNSLRDYAQRHGLSHEGFRLQVRAMQRRLRLPLRPTQNSDAN